MRLHKKTLQETFDFVGRHLLTQGRRASGKFTCQYRTKDGLSCAVGCLIPEDKYLPEMEGKNVQLFLLNKEFGFTVAGQKYLYLLQELQRIHDSHSPQTWKEQLKLLAKEFNLKFTLGRVKDNTKLQTGVTK